MGRTTESRRRPTRVVGLDLAGSPKRDTGACRFSGLHRIQATVLHSDPEILDFVENAEPELVVIDAPLSIPHGRRTIEDRSGPHLRACDRELLRRKLPFFPITLGPMRMLTARGIRLAAELTARGFSVVEGYPGGAQDLLGIPRKSAGVSRLQRALRSRGLGGELARRALTHDELDAVTLGWVGWDFRHGRGELIGDPTEGLMLLPIPRRAARHDARSKRIRRAKKSTRRS